MKIVIKYLKPFVALLLVCLVLLFGQVVSDLSLPNLMSDIVNVGIQQNGVEEGAPEAMSANAMELLKTMLDEKEQALLNSAYFTYEVGSSESQRYMEKYPLAQTKAICVRNTTLEEEDSVQVDEVYAKAAYTFMLYMQSAAESGELEQVVAGLSGGASQVPAESSLPEGYLRDIPEGSVFSMPEASQAMASGDLTVANITASAQENSPDGYIVGGAGPEGGAQPDFSEDTIPDSSEDAKPSVPGEESVPSQGDLPSMDFNFSAEDGYDSIDPKEIYQLIPILKLVPQESIASAREQASGEAASMLSAQVGITFKRLFYQEVGIDLAAMQSAYIWQKGGQMLLVALLGVVAAILVGFFLSRIAAHVAMKMRRDLFAKVESFSGAEYDQFSTASLITRTTNDVQQVQMLLTMGLRMMCYAPMMGIGGIIFAVGKSPSMSWLIAGAVVVLLGVIAVVMAVAMPKFTILQKLIDRLNLVSRENLSGMMVVRAFGNEKYEEARFAKANEDLADTNRFVQRMMSGMMPAMMLVMNILSLLIVWVGGHAIAESTLQIGDMMAFIQYAMQIIMSFLFIAMMFVMVPRARVSALRIAQVLNTPLMIKDDPEAKPLPEVKGELEFKDVSFRYENAEENVLEHISFTAKPGETTAFIGATGSGKSTLVNLIPRFYDVTEGSITLDGVDVRSIPQEQLRGNIGYVPQKGMLFSGTVESNLRYGKEDAGPEELYHALEIAQAKDFVSEMEEGVESGISQGGANVSGGQRQRLSIARALMKQAPIYIFDDSFSALDFRTDATLRRALREDTEKSTVLIVAQRVSTIMHAQQILVLDNGKVVGKGTHQELLANCPEYREIAESQLQKEELS